MSIQETSFVHEQNIPAPRSLAQRTTERVILRLTSYSNPHPLDEHDAIALNIALRGSQRGAAAHRISHDGISIYLDYPIGNPKGSGQDDLQHAVEQVSDGLLKTFAPAAVVGAWVTHDNAPSVSELAASKWQGVDVVTEQAKQIFDEHRLATINHVFDRLLFETA